MYKKKTGTNQAGRTITVRIDTQVNLTQLYNSALAIGLYVPCMAIDQPVATGVMTIQQFPALNATTAIYEGYYVKGVQVTPVSVAPAQGYLRSIIYKGEALLVQQNNPPVTYLDSATCLGLINNDTSKSVLTQYFGGGMRPLTRKCNNPYNALWQLKNTSSTKFDSINETYQSMLSKAMFLFNWIAPTAPTSGYIDFRIVYKLGVRKTNVSYNVAQPGQMFQPLNLFGKTQPFHQKDILH